MSQATLTPVAPSAQREQQATTNILGSWWQRLCQFDLLRALPLITVVLLLENADEVWYLRTPLILMCVTGLVYGRLMQSTGFWFTMATLLGATVYLQWDSVDNHKYLFVYWCLALSCAFSLAPVHRGAALAITSRTLLGLCMALAVIWKLATPNYLDGSFFEYTLLVDGRFTHFAAALTSLPRAALFENQQLEGLLTGGYLRGLSMDTVQLTSSPDIRLLALFLTWWTVLIEGLLAVLFLVPGGRRMSLLRNSTLLLFAVSTYPIATVRGFGWMLMLLGMAQCDEPRDRPFRFGYLVAFLLVEVFTLPLRFLFDA